MRSIIIRQWTELEKTFEVDHRLFQAMGMEDAGLTCGAVCVYPNRVAECVEALKRFSKETDKSPPPFGQPDRFLRVFLLTLP